MDLDPGSPNCVDAPAGTTCTLSLVLRPGSYTASIVTYDGPLNGSGSVTGTLLSQDQSFPMTVVAGKANDPTITLYGVPTGLQLVSLSPNLRVVTNSPLFLTVPTILVAGQGVSARFAVYATDPDGYFILGPGAPTFAVSVNGGFSATAGGNIVRLAVPAPANTSVTPMTFTATSPACTSVAACTWITNAGFDSLLAIADSGNDDVAIQTAGSNPTAPVVTAVTNGIDQPIDVQFDASGNLFVANYLNSTVTEYAPPYTGSPVATISNGVSGPNQLVLGPSGTLAVVNAGGGNVTVYTAPYVNQTPVTIAKPSFVAAFDSSGNLWLATTSSGIQRYQPPFSSASATASMGVSSPFGIAFDSVGNLYVANHGNDTLEKFTLGSYAAPAATAALPGATSVSITGSFIVACGTGNAYLYGSSLTSPLVDPAGPTPCHAAFDRLYGLWLTVPDDKLVIDYLYPPGVAGELIQSLGLSNPVAIASFPGAPP
jgi:hypothetical protein